MAPRDGGAAKTIIRTDKGISEQDGVLSRHPWAEIAGVFKGTEAGVRIEDNPANLDLMVYLLEAFGHTTIAMDSGNTACQAAIPAVLPWLRGPKTPIFSTAFMRVLGQWLPSPDSAFVVEKQDG